MATLVCSFLVHELYVEIGEQAMQEKILQESTEMDEGLLMSPHINQRDMG